MRVFSWAVLLILLGSVAVVAQQAGRLTVVGQASVEAVPDMATITLGVVSEARTAQAALASNSADTADILALVQRAQILPRDVQTSGLSLSPVWNNRNSNSGARPAIVGYTASNRITIRVRDLDQLGKLLDAVVTAGATQFNGLSFGLQDPVPAKDNARRAAVADAARKAGLYADAAGITLGAIVQLSETGAAQPGPAAFQEFAVSRAVPIAPGEVSVSASVTIVYEISQ